jgi:hypothetical protein
MRLLSLDFDGPLHPVSAIPQVTVAGHALDRLVEDRNLFRWLPMLVCLVADHPDVLIAVHSNWRKYASNAQLRQYLGPLADRFIGITSPEQPRYEGILAFAERAGADHVLVIDDDLSQFPAVCEALLAVDPEVGISDEAILASLANWLRETSPQDLVSPRP